MASQGKHRTVKHTKEHQKEKQWWLSLAYALGRLRVRSLALLEKTRGFGMTPTDRSARCFFKLTHTDFSMSSGFL
jgi:hypothetical protein